MEGASDVGAAKDVGQDVRAKFGCSRSNRSWDIQPTNFITMKTTDYSTRRPVANLWHLKIYHTETFANAVNEDHWNVAVIRNVTTIDKKDIKQKYYHQNNIKEHMSKKAHPLNWRER